MERYLFTYDVGQGEELATIEGDNFFDCLIELARQHPGRVSIYIVRFEDITPEEPAA